MAGFQFHSWFVGVCSVTVVSSSSISARVAGAVRSLLKLHCSSQKEYMDRQISQTVEYYSREEKRLRLHFDQFCNLLQLKHVLQCMSNQTMCTNVLKTLKKAQRPKKALDPSKSHHFETVMCGTSYFRAYGSTDFAVQRTICRSIYS